MSENGNKALMNKEFPVGKGFCTVALYNYNGMYVVKADGNEVYRSANQIFAIQRFNSI